MGKKAQASLEFLTTYGWAFLIILIMIGALGYFGILNPSKILPNRCTFSSEFSCMDYQINSGTSQIKLRMKNNEGEPIVISSFTVSSETTTQLSCTAPTNIGASNSWGPSEVRDFELTGCTISQSGFQQGEKEKVLVTIEYYSVKSGSAYLHQSKGEIFSIVV